MLPTAKRLHYRVNAVLEFCEDFYSVKGRNKLLHKVAEEHNLELVEMIYLDLSS